jgi:hypothetical protein
MEIWELKREGEYNRKEKISDVKETKREGDST